ncbi:MAG: RnfABCDGE type electron transport complex subunit D [Candidatus Aenigmarchaeota archaeon]|nr:RnfABCDGE type electron transport complex subunit D [Candidatus Aenigmarchaeota archaeon]
MDHIQDANIKKENMLNYIKVRYNRITIYKQMIATLFLLVIISSLGVGLQLITNTAISISSIFLFHFIVSKLRKKEEISYESVAITGLLIGLILLPDTPYAIVLASLAAVLSKRIKLNGRHLLNPAMSGVFFAILLTNSSDAWVGASSLLLVLILGIPIAQKYRRLHLIVPFVFTHMSLSVIHKLYYNIHPVYHDLFGGLIYFLAFFMLLEPKTTPITKNARIAYGIISAVIIFVLGLTIPKYAVTGGLLICNLLIQPIEKIFK